MNDSFIQLFQQACRESSSQAVARQAETDEKYVECFQRSKALFEHIQEQLEESEQKLLYRFEEAENEQSAMREKWIYRQGFRDCFELLQWIGAIRRE